MHALQVELPHVRARVVRPAKVTVLADAGAAITSLNMAIFVVHFGPAGITLAKGQPKSALPRPKGSRGLLQNPNANVWWSSNEQYPCARSAYQTPVH